MCSLIDMPQERGHLSPHPFLASSVQYNCLNQTFCSAQPLTSLCADFDGSSPRWEYLFPHIELSHNYTGNSVLQLKTKSALSQLVSAANESALALISVQLFIRLPCSPIRCYPFGDQPSYFRALNEIIHHNKAHPNVQDSRRMFMPLMNNPVRKFCASSLCCPPTA